MRGPALFVALAVVFFVWTFPHQLVVERLVRTTLAGAGVDSSIEQVKARWPKIVRMSVSPPGYLLGGLRLSRGPDRATIETLYLGFGLRGGIDIEGDACRGSWRGKLQRGRRLELTFTGVEPGACLDLAGLGLEGRFGGAVALRGLGRGDKAGAAGRAAREGTVSIEGHAVRLSGSQAAARLSGLVLDRLDLEAALAGPSIVLDGSAAESQGVEWKLPSASIVRRGGGLQVEGELAVRDKTGTSRAKLILALLPEGLADPGGWRHYRLSGPLVRPKLTALH